MKQVLLHLHILCRLKKENYCSGRLSIVSLVKEEGRVSTQVLAAPKLILTFCLCPYFLPGVFWESTGIWLGKPALERMSAWHLVTAYLTAGQVGSKVWGKGGQRNAPRIQTVSVTSNEKLSLADLSRERLFIVSQNCPGSRKSSSKDRWKHSPKHPATPEGILPPVGAAC